MIEKPQNGRTMRAWLSLPAALLFSASVLLVSWLLDELDPAPGTRLTLLLMPLPLFLLFGLAIFVLTPFLNAFSRHNETTCDKFGLELTHDNRAAAIAFVKLQQNNLANPRPGLLYKLWRADHPPVGERIDLANTYKPWETGQPLKFAKHFRAVSIEEVEHAGEGIETEAAEEASPEEMTASEESSGSGEQE